MFVTRAEHRKINKNTYLLPNDVIIKQIFTNECQNRFFVAVAPSDQKRPIFRIELFNNGLRFAAIQSPMVPLTLMSPGCWTLVIF